MTQDLLDLLPQWGPWLLAASAFLSCMMIPLPTSFLLMTAGALTGTGHLDLPLMILGATLGATAGDIAAFLLARRIGPWLARPGTRRAVLMGRARDFIARRGVLAVFLSRWLVTPIAPATNYVAGAAGLPLSLFILASAGGELIWAVLHLIAAHAATRMFRDHEQAFVIAIATGAVLAAILGVWHWRRGGRTAIYGPC